MDIKELLPKDTEGRLRIIQETVPGRQITLAHVITSPKPIVYRKLGLTQISILIVLRLVSSQLPQVNLL